MSQSPSSEVHLTVTAGSPLAEVFLIDDKFALVNRSVGDLACAVDPGVYKVKAKLGDAVYERLVLLDEDQALDVSGDLAVSSAVPIQQSALESSGPIQAAQAESRRIATRAGDGAQVFLTTRSRAVPFSTPGHAPELSLQRLDGTTIATLEPPAGAAADEHSTTIEVDPRAYIVQRRDRFGDAAEQCVYTVAGWQTQVFVLEDDGDEDETGRTRVSVQMSRYGFDPLDPELPLIEQARTALADERKVASEQLDELLAESDNPMLGLFGAHLMLIARDTMLRDAERRKSGRLDDRVVAAPVQFDQAHFDRIVDWLSVVLGPAHADVVALATHRTDQALEALEPITAPPMLWRSWVLLIAASNDVPALVPVHAWQRTLHVLPLRPFFLWAPAADSSEIRETWTRNVVRTLTADERTPPTPGVHLPTRSSVVNSGDRPAALAAARRRVSETLLVPRAAIDRLADGQPL